MILLTSTSDLIQAVSGSTGNIDVHASYVDYNGTVVTPGRTNTAQITTAATTTIVGSPGASTQRNAKHISIRNAHASTSNAITVQHYDGTTTTTLVKYTLLAGESLQYWDERGWIVIDASGGIKNSPSAGRLLARTVKTSGTTHTTQMGTTSFWVCCVGSGGSGGGNPATANTAGSGGGAGGYVEKLYNGKVGNQTYTVAIGASKTGTSNAAGTAGDVTTFTDGTTLITAQGGTAGLLAVAATSVAGGAASTVSTNGDLNGAGAAGQDGISGSATAQGGKGGDTIYGAGGGTSTANLTVGKAAVGFGGGGGGSCTLATATAQAGGSSGAGVIIIEEYS
jgi:hypothetical protein